MRIIVTVDDALGVAFNHRRQSRDRILCADVLASLGASDTLVVAPYSQPLFSSGGARVCVREHPWEGLGVGEVAFLECTCVTPFADRIGELTVYRWNRHYPQDVSLGIHPECIGLPLAERSEFQGSSHDKITKEVYRR